MKQMYLHRSSCGQEPPIKRGYDRKFKPTAVGGGRLEFPVIAPLDRRFLPATRAVEIHLFHGRVVFVLLAAGDVTAAKVSDDVGAVVVRVVTRGFVEPHGVQ